MASRQRDVSGLDQELLVLFREWVSLVSDNASGGSS